MENEFHLYRGFDTTTHQGCEAPGSNQAGQALPIFSDFQQLCGEGSEPDPLFFIESWTLGTPAAVENFRLRQPVHADDSGQSRVNASPVYTSTQSFFQSNPLNWSVFVSVDTVVSENSNPARLEQRSNGPHPSGFDSFGDRDAPLPMNREQARKILGVAPGSTLGQIKTAHRRLVIAWHPDRIQHTSEETRHNATAKMAIINEAYRLLRVDSLNHSA